MDPTAAVALVVTVALVFGATNGALDAPAALASSVSTRALTPALAVAVATGLNLVGSFLGQRVARTISQGVVVPEPGPAGLAVLLAGLVGAIAWNLVTWRLGLPSSSTAALVGGLAGAGLAGAALSGAAQVRWSVLATTVLLPALVAPAVGLLLGHGVMLGVQRAFRHAAPGRANRRFRSAQAVSAAAVALGHGLQDAQKTMGVIVLALVTGGLLPAGSPVPLWAVAASATALAAGTCTGGWRVVHTLGWRLAVLDPPRGFVAETVTAGVLYGGAVGLGAPVSTMHTLTAALTGVGATRRLSAVRWRVVRSIAWVWALTVPASAAIAALSYGLTRPLLG